MTLSSISTNTLLDNARNSRVEQIIDELEKDYAVVWKVESADVYDLTYTIQVGAPVTPNARLDELFISRLESITKGVSNENKNSYYLVCQGNTALGGLPSRGHQADFQKTNRDKRYKLTRS